MFRVQTLGLVDRGFPPENGLEAESVLEDGETPGEPIGLRLTPWKDLDHGYRRRRRIAWLLAGLFHSAILLLLILWFRPLPPSPDAVPVSHPLPRLVFLASPGPGGGGGGGGHRESTPVSQLRRRVKNRLRAPVPPRVVAALSSPTVIPEPAEPELPPLKLDAISSPADALNKTGEPERAAALLESSGPGSGEGAGSGQGTGIGPGLGPGLGPGWGGGTGGGPYRPGSGVTPPVLIQQVRPAYTIEAIRQKIQGEVVLEVIITREGKVAEPRVIRSLDSVYGLDKKAMEAVRVWRFIPGRFRGEAVDVLAVVVVKFHIF